ncbi:MAG: phosphate ABC transporter permease subunit PstC [Phycisphaerales bacterium]|nr:phosphate ABC transporter permease subunit PstC [Phycisphaerales bacterium]
MTSRQAPGRRNALVLSKRASRLNRLAALLGHGLLLLLTLSSVLSVLFIFYFIIRDAIPFFQLRGFREFFAGTQWYPSANPASFGAFPIFLGSMLVTAGAVMVAVPFGVCASVCLSDILPFTLRQLVKPVIEILAAIPSVAFGFFALVVFAPRLQADGGGLLSVASWMIGAPVAGLTAFILSDLLTAGLSGTARWVGRGLLLVVLGALAFWGLWAAGSFFRSLDISSGTNALNVSIILGIMALPTVISVSEDALQAVGRELREGAYALGSTRAETLLRVVMPAASSGICAAVILGVMRAFGETMVVWMASGNAAHVPSPWYNLLQPVRTLTATIAGDMGEADHVTGSERYHVLFAMALVLLTVSFVFSWLSERVVSRAVRIRGGQ